AERALRAGRGLGAEAAALLSPAPLTRNVEPVLKIRRHEAGAYLQELRGLGRPPVNPRLVVRGAAVAVVPGRAGTTPQGNRLLAAVERQVLAGKRVVRLFFRPAAPAITRAAAAAAAWRARLVVSAPVTVTHRGASL